MAERLKDEDRGIHLEADLKASTAVPKQSGHQLARYRQTAVLTSLSTWLTRRARGHAGTSWQRRS